MAILDFFREYINIRRESKSYCKSCEILREQLAREIYEKQRLLDKFVLIQSAPVEIPSSSPEPIIPKIVPWRVQRELLEAEDRSKAAIIRKQKEEAEHAKKAASGEPIEIKEISISELEKELAIGGE